MNNASIRIGSIAAVSSLAALTFVGAAVPANAATGPTNNQCLVSKGYTNIVHHGEKSHPETVVVPGKDAVSHEENRWSRQVPEVGEASHKETKFQRTILGNEEISHEQWLNKWFVPGNEEESHFLYQFSRENPGQAEEAHLLYQFFKENPGKQEVAQLLYKFSKENPGQKEVSHLLYQFIKENPGQKELSQLLYKFSKENPGQKEVSHPERQFSKSVPAQIEISHLEFKYQKVTPNSHQENRYKKSMKVYTVEHKKVQIPTQGRDRDKLLTWLNSIGATDLGGNWWQLPDATVAKAGVNPFNVAQSGNVNMSAYGGPSVTVSYQITGIETYDQPPAGSFVELNNQTVYYTGGSSFSLKASDAIWTRDTPAGWNGFENRTVKDPDTITPYNNGDWTKDVNPAGFTKIDQKLVIDQIAIAAHAEYRKADGSSTVNLADAGWFTQSSFPGWAQYGSDKKVVTVQYIAPFKEYRTADGSASTNPADAAEFVQSAFVGWTAGTPRREVTQEYIAPFNEYRTADGGASTNPADAAKFPESSFEGWGQYGDPEKVVDVDYIAPFKEYRTADGTPSADKADAAKFPESSFEGWEQNGEAEKVVTQDATEDQTFYLTKDTQGNLGQTTVKSEASPFTDADAAVDSKWVQFDIEKIVDKEAIADKTVYLTMSSKGIIGESDDASDADWVWTGDTDVDLTIWQQTVNELGDPLIRTVIDQPARPGYAEYYVPNGEPTRELGKTNWTTDKPKEWNFVDNRTVEDEKAVPPTTKTITKVDKEAWDESVQVAAKYEACPPLASTGANDPWGPASIAGLALGGGIALLAVGGVVSRRRTRHLGEEA